jgi:hypothetical protein
MESGKVGPEILCKQIRIDHGDVGQLTLRNLRLKKGALDKFRLPVDVLEGIHFSLMVPLSAANQIVPRPSRQIHTVPALDESRQPTRRNIDRGRLSFGCTIAAN